MYNNYIFDLYGTLIDINTDEWNDDLWKKIAIFLLLNNTNASSPKAESSDLFSVLAGLQAGRVKE